MSSAVMPSLDRKCAVHSYPNLQKRQFVTRALGKWPQEHPLARFKQNSGQAPVGRAKNCKRSPQTLVLVLAAFSAIGANLRTIEPSSPVILFSPPVLDRSIA
jgi:hypothetical protein